MSSLSQMIERIEKGSGQTLHVTAKVQAKNELPSEGIVLSLCDGMGCAARALQDLGMAPSHYIGVENNPTSKKVAQNLNPVTSVFKGVDHSRFSDVMKITRADISELGQDAIDKVFFGAPCEDFSFLRLLPNRQGKLPPQGSNPRPGLDGPKGKILRQCIKILGWVLEFNPSALYFVENVDFSDMKSDWKEVCDALGTPFLVNSSDHSYTKRRRAYWTNADIPADFKENHPPLKLSLIHI